jgi:hypothetical protein
MTRKRIHRIEPNAGNRLKRPSKSRKRRSFLDKSEFTSTAGFFYLSASREMKKLRIFCKLESEVAQYACTPMPASYWIRI